MKKIIYIILAVLIVSCSSDVDDSRDADTTPPVITLIGSANISVTRGDNYTDAGSTATDNVDGNLTSNITVQGSVNINELGDYPITYSVSDSSGNSASVSRLVSVVSDLIAPVITITGNSTLDVPQYVIYDDSGATATDDVDGDLTASIQVSGVLDTNTIGTYTITYSVSDSAGNSSSANRTVNVIDDGNSVYLDQNGVTIKAKSWANVGDTGVINGVTYTIVDETMLRQTISPNLVNQICTTKVTNMENIILDVMDVYSGAFAGDISTWDVSNVTTMRRMFWGDGFRDGFGFNQPIGDWDVSNVTDMREMFRGSLAFNQPIGDWDVSSVTDMTYMFQGAEVFNQPIGDWDVSSVTDMTFILGNAYSFNQPLSNWDVSNVINMRYMFHECYNFNQDISSWDVSNVINMHWMFNGAKSFNQPIGVWDVSNVTKMDGMFQVLDTSGSVGGEFNQDISSWDVSNVTKMDGMFNNQVKYNQNLSSWDVENVTSCGNFSIKAVDWTLPRPIFTNCTP